MTTRTTASPPHVEFAPTARRAGPVARWAAAIGDDFRHLVRFWPVTQNMVVQELRVRYQRSVLGFFWTLLHPVLMMATLTLVFSQLMRVPSQDRDWRYYAIYVFAGMVPWTFLSCSINESAFCIIQNEGLIRKIYLPKLVFPLVRVLINLTTFLLSMFALFALLVPLGARPSWAMLMLPPIVLMFAAFSMGLSLIVAAANTFFRDCGHLVSVFLQAWYFATPIIYYGDQLPAAVQRRFWLNPAYPYIRAFQAIILEGTWPDAFTVGISAALAAACLGVGYAAFKSHEDKLVFRL